MRRLLLIPASIVLFFTALILTTRYQNIKKLDEWLSNVPSVGQTLYINGRTIYTETKGSQKPTVLVLPGFGISLAEWRPFTNLVSPKYQTVLVNRVGYPWSSRRPIDYDLQMATEDILGVINNVPADKIVLVAQTTSVILSLEVATRIKDKISGILLIDPAFDPSSLKKSLTDEQYKILFDRRDMFENAIPIAKLGLFRWFNTTAYDVPESIRDDVINHLSDPSAMKDSLYELGQFLEVDSKTVLNKEKIPDVPIFVIGAEPKRLSDFYIETGLSEETAKTISHDIAQFQKQLSELSAKGSYTNFQKSLFSSHIDEAELIAAELNKLIQLR